jgi:hypothetical protein
MVVVSPTGVSDERLYTSNRQDVIVEDINGGDHHPLSAERINVSIHSATLMRTVHNANNQDRNSTPQSSMMAQHAVAGKQMRNAQNSAFAPPMEQGDKPSQRRSHEEPGALLMAAQLPADANASPVDVATTAAVSMATTAWIGTDVSTTAAPAVELRTMSSNVGDSSAADDGGSNLYLLFMAFLAAGTVILLIAVPGLAGRVAQLIAPSPPQRRPSRNCLPSDSGDPADAAGGPVKGGAHMKLQEDAADATRSSPTSGRCRRSNLSPGRSGTPGVTPSPTAGGKVGSCISDVRRSGVDLSGFQAWQFADDDKANENVGVPRGRAASNVADTNTEELADRRGTKNRSRSAVRYDALITPSSPTHGALYRSNSDTMAPTREVVEDSLLAARDMPGCNSTPATESMTRGNSSRSPARGRAAAAQQQEEIARSSSAKPRGRNAALLQEQTG